MSLQCRCRNDQKLGAIVGARRECGPGGAAGVRAQRERGGEGAPRQCPGLAAPRGRVAERGAVPRECRAPCEVKREHATSPQ
ncbi:unnamed protein product [Parnassius apollo]|uniref:(apollo) hypothetical protein n=1 Tax=Parnassius apollo TaxID=110799 RepID=A0A8S3XBX5_PARAO|nr:unnamed protein product [Parnassius apollo]